MILTDHYYFLISSHMSHRKIFNKQSISGLNRLVGIPTGKGFPLALKIKKNLNGSNVSRRALPELYLLSNVRQHIFFHSSKSRCELYNRSVGIPTGNPFPLGKQSIIAHFKKFKVKTKG